MLIDTHFHLDLMDNMHLLIQELRTANVGIIAVGTTPKAYEREQQFCMGAENIHVGLGMHPQLIAEREHETELFLSLMRKSRYIGEVGLDFNSDFISFKDQQISCFRKVVNACSDEGGKILSIHSVKATGTVIDELSDAGTFRNNICIFHWFTGSTFERRRAIEAGAWFSVNPRMLKTKGGQETIKEIPANRILLETDAPFTMKVTNVNSLVEELNRLVGGISSIRGERLFEQISETSTMLIEGK